MAFRTITAEPHELQRLADAFDTAWIAVNADMSVERMRVSAEQERLSAIIIHLWQTDPNADLITLAVRRFRDEAAAAMPKDWPSHANPAETRPSER